MSPIVLSKEKRRQQHQNKTRVLCNPLCYLEERRQLQNKRKVLCHPLLYLKKKEDNNTKTKHKLYVAHCISREKRRP